MKKKVFIVAATIISSKMLFAQKQDSSNTKQLDEVVVTATKSSLKQSQTGKIVTVIDRQTIRNNVGRSLSELLNEQAGFFINGSNNSPGTNLDLYFRGAGTGNTLVVIDGIPVYDPSQPNNSFDLNSIPLDQVERIEILKGGQSTIWGSDAVAGVIQIFLKKEAKKPITANGSLSYGSYNSLQAGAGIGGNILKFGYSIQYNYSRSDGISSAHDSIGNGGFDKDGFRQNSLLADLSYAFSQHFSARAFGSFGQYHNALDGGAFTDDKDYEARNSNNLGGITFRFHKKRFSWYLQGSLQRADRSFVDDSADISSPYSKYSYGKFLGNSSTIETFGSGNIAKNLQLVGGIQYIQQTTSQSYLSISDFGNYESNLGKDSAKIRQYSAYASLLAFSSFGLNLEVGGRINHHNIYGNNETFTLNPSFNLNENTRLFLNISSAYKIPSLYQLYGEFGNKDLNPESSITYELGLQTQTTHNNIYMRLALFKTDTRNLIIFYTDPITYAGKYFNRDEQHNYGAELESRIRIGKAAIWKNNLSYVDGSGREDNKKVWNLYRRPKFSLNSSLTLEIGKKLNIIPAFKFIGERIKGPFDAGPEKQPAYYTIDCFGAYSFTEKFRLFLDLRNLTNQEYFDIPGYNSKRFNLMAGFSFKL
jgi:vitamin B12 transporter